VPGGGGGGGAGAAGGGVVVVLRLWLVWVFFGGALGCASGCALGAVAGCSKRAMTRALLLPRARDCLRGCFKSLECGAWGLAAGAWRGGDMTFVTPDGDV